MISRNNISVPVTDGLDSIAQAEGLPVRDPIRVWLVDDSDNYRALLADFLGSEAGFECSRQFHSAEAVLEALARETPPDAILLDIQMGGISGLDAVRPIKSIAGATHVLMLTSLSDSYSKTCALRDGASDFLLKSWEIAEIPKHIRQAVEKPLLNESVVTEEGKMQDASGAEPLPGDFTNGVIHDPCSAGSEKKDRPSASRRCTPPRLRWGVRYLRAWLKRGS